MRIRRKGTKYFIDLNTDKYLLSLCKDELFGYSCLDCFNELKVGTIFASLNRRDRRLVLNIALKSVVGRGGSIRRLSNQVNSVRGP